MYADDKYINQVEIIAHTISAKIPQYNKMQFR